MHLPKLLRPTHYVYLMVHALLFFAGVLLALLAGSRQEPSQIWVGLGTALLATGITGWVVFVYLFMSESRSRQIKLLDEVGVTGAFNSRSLTIRDEYDSRISKASKQIDVMGFGLSALRRDHLRNFAAWSKQADMRILLIDREPPDGRESYADQRDREEYESDGKIRTDVSDFIVGCEKEGLKPRTGGKFQVRLYTCLPSINYFRIDDEILWGPYLIGQSSHNLPTFIVRRGGTLFGRLENHFDDIWKNDTFSRPLPDDAQS